MVNILLIEDDLDDVELLENTFEGNSFEHRLEVINDGDEAIQYIKSCKNYPDLIILDFNLPKVHGRDILMEIKSLDNFENIPILILTTSSAKEDIDFANKNGANKFLIKPTNTNEIKSMYNSIVELLQKTY